MTTTTVNLQMHVGTDVRIVLRLKHGETPIDLAGYTAVLRCPGRLNLSTDTDDGIVLGGAEGTITITRNPNQTRSIQFGGSPVASKVLRRQRNGVAVVATGHVDEYRLDLISPGALLVHRALVGHIVFIPEVGS